MKKVLLILTLAVTGLISAQDMNMDMDMDMDKKMMDAGMIMHGKMNQHFGSSEALIVLGTTGKAAAFVRECLEMGFDASLGFTPSPFAAGMTNYTDLSPVKLLTMKEAEINGGIKGFAPETANVTIKGIKYTFRMVAPVVVKDNFVVQGGGYAARYDLGQSEGEDGKVKLVEKIKISKMNMR